VSNQSFETRHKPRRFDDLIFADALVGDALGDYALRRRYGSILLHGGYGTAKSTTAEVIVRSRVQLFGSTNDRIERLTGTELRNKNIGVVDNALGMMITTHNFDEKPYVIIDEVDMAPMSRQVELRNLIDATNAAKFILTTNNPHKVDRGLVDRCDTYLISPPRAQHMVKRAQEILQVEGCSVSNRTLGQALQGVGSVREMLRALDGLIVNMQASSPPPPKPPVFTVLEGGEPPPTS